MKALLALLGVGAVAYYISKQGNVDNQPSETLPAPSGDIVPKGAPTPESAPGAQPIIFQLPDFAKWAQAPIPLVQEPAGTPAVSTSPSTSYAAPAIQSSGYSVLGSSGVATTAPTAAIVPESPTTTPQLTNKAGSSLADLLSVEYWRNFFFPGTSTGILTVSKVASNQAGDTVAEFLPSGAKYPTSFLFSGPGVTNNPKLPEGSYSQQSDTDYATTYLYKPAGF